jgi:hypothetical protein
MNEGETRDGQRQWEGSCCLRVGYSSRCALADKTRTAGTYLGLLPVVASREDGLAADCLAGACAEPREEMKLTMLSVHENM